MTYTVAASTRHKRLGGSRLGSFAAGSMTSGSFARETIVCLCVAVFSRLQDGFNIARLSALAPGAIISFLGDGPRLILGDTMEARTPDTVDCLLTRGSPILPIAREAISAARPRRRSRENVLVRQPYRLGNPVTSCSFSPCRSWLYSTTYSLLICVFDPGVPPPAAVGTWDRRPQSKTRHNGFVQVRPR